MSKPLITVFGATGRQGGALAQALLAQGEWRVRAVTRQPQAAAALTLAARGAEICQADLDQPDSLGPAMAGAHGVFAVTDFWQHLDARRERRQAEHLAQAAAGVRGLRQLVWSTLEDTRDFFPADGSHFALLQGAYNVPHMDAKGEANASFIQRGLPVTLLLTSFYWDNLLAPGLGPQRAADGVLELALPLGDARLPGIAVADIGACAAALFDGTEGQRRVGIASEHLRGPELAERLAEHLGEPVRFRDVPLDEFARLPFPGAEDLAAMFRFKQIANDLLCAARPVAATRALHPGLQDLRGWLRRQAAPR
jgi:uncharacterized protein YbjT (DUF2867 family)